MDLFEIEVAMPPLAALVERAKVAIRNVFSRNMSPVIAYSSGKDSTCVLSLVLEVAKEMVAEGHHPKIVVSNSDTLVESPEIRAHIRSESRKIKAYAAKHGIALEYYVSRPNLMSTFQIKVLSGRGLPAYPGQNADCSVDWKIIPQQRLRKQLFAKLKKEGRGDACTLLGTRFSESEKRMWSMRGRGENPDTPVQNRDGEWTLSPIAMWATDDVWEYLGEIVNGDRQSYTDCQELFRIYADAGGTSCAVVSDALLEGLSKGKAGRCGARTGCWACLQAQDKSLRTMVEGDPRYHYAIGLTRFNDYLRAIRWDWSKRHWIGRTVQEGWLCVQPDTFHAVELRRQARMLMQLDHDERERAYRSGEQPKFEILSLEMLITLDALWSANGMAPPFAIWADKRDIEAGIRYDVPEHEPVVPESPIPDARFMFVGEEWNSDVWDGLRDSYLEGLTENSPCQPTVAEDGLWKVPTEVAFTVDPEAADLFEQFEMEWVLEKYSEKLPPGGITAGFKHYMGLGTLSISHSQRKSIDQTLRRTALKHRMGLSYDYKIDEVLAKSVRYAEMPPEARKVWRHKATTANSQPEFDFS